MMRVGNFPPEEAQQVVACQEAGWVERLIGFSPFADDNTEQIFLISAASCEMRPTQCRKCMRQKCGRGSLTCTWPKSI